ncbi:MAG: hypothetical protein PHW04_19210, partial [Candidatus Wallbacteria bacterium]|nr:hypothetical protein [Candidatus Wallbacteria bacterium]
TCFAEAWLRAGTKDKPAGCLTFAGASTNMAWVPPCTWIKEIITEQTCKKKNDIILVQHTYGILKTMEEYGIEDKKEGNQLFEQTHIFGDGTATVRTEAAARVTIYKSRSEDSFTVKIKDAGAGLVVAAYDDNHGNMIVSRTNQNGETTLNLNGQTMFSVTGDSIEPSIDNEI